LLVPHEPTAKSDVAVIVAPMLDVPIAVIVVCPGALQLPTAVANPAELMVATRTSLETHVT
jgi:hypothetical protein